MGAQNLLIQILLFREAYWFSFVRVKAFMKLRHRLRLDERRGIGWRAAFPTSFAGLPSFGGAFAFAYKAREQRGILPGV